MFRLFLPFITYFYIFVSKLILNCPFLGTIIKVKGAIAIFYLNIKPLRHKRHLKQAELAKLSKVSSTYLSELENNNKKKVEGVSLKTITKIANALNVPGDEVLKWEENRDDEKEKQG